MQTLESWKVAQMFCVRAGGGARTSSEAKWIKPPSGWLKCNTDAGAFFSSGSFGSRAVIRDSPGAFLAAKSCTEP